MRRIRILLGLLLVFLSFSTTVSTHAAFEIPAVNSLGISPSAYNSTVGSALGGTGNFYSSCFNFSASINQTGNLIKQLSDDKSKTSASPQSLANMMGGDCLSMQCTGPETGPDASTLSCDVLGRTKDAFNTSLKARSEQLNLALNTLTCKKTKAECVSAELNCLSSKANIVNQQVASVREEYNRNITQMKQQLNTFVNDEGDIQQQDKFLAERMNNDINAGNPGILKLRDATEQLVNNTLPTQIQASTDKLRLLTQKRRELDEIVVRKKISQTTQCFAQEDTGNYCKGEDTLAKWATRARPKAKSCGYGSWCDYLVCRYWENNRLAAGGVNIKASTKQDADNKVRNFAALIDSILNRSPKSPQVPQTQDQANNPQFNASQFADAVNLFDPGTINSQYGSQLSQFNGAELNVKDLFVRKLTQCYNKQSQIVDNERQRALGDIGKAVFDIKSMENTTSLELRNTLDNYATHIGKVYAGMTGRPFVPDTSLCKNATADTMVSCLQNIQTSLNNLLNREPVALSIPAKSPNNSFLIRCSGLVGCASDMQKARELLEVRKGQIQASKKSFIQQAKQATETFTNSIKARFEASNSMLQAQKDRINQALGSLGGRPISTSKQFQGVVPLKTSSEPGMEGMVEVPDDVVGLIASRMNPPLMDSNADGYNDAISSMGSVSSRYEQRLSSVQQSLDMLSNKRQECVSLKEDRILTSLNTNVMALNNCTKINQWCDPAGKNTLQNLVNSAMDITGENTDRFNSITSALNDGVTACDVTIAANAEMQQRSAEYSNTKREIERLKIEVARTATTINSLQQKIDQTKDESKKEAYIDQQSQLNEKLQELQAEQIKYAGKDVSAEDANRFARAGVESAVNLGTCGSVTGSISRDLETYKREVATSQSEGKTAK